MTTYHDRLDALEAALKALGVIVPADALDEVARSVQDAIDAGEEQEGAVRRSSAIVRVRLPTGPPTWQWACAPISARLLV